MFPEGPALDAVADALVDSWLSQVAALDLRASSRDYIEAQARLLGVSTRGARAELHRPKPHHRILELPGTGGQLALHLLETHSDLHLSTNVVIATASWQERTLAGLVAVELGHRGPAPVVFDSDPQLAIVRRDDSKFDYVVGLAPEKGGAFAADDLHHWFSPAKVLLV